MLLGMRDHVEMVVGRLPELALESAQATGEWPEVSLFLFSFTVFFYKKNLKFNYFFKKNI